MGHDYAPLGADLLDRRAIADEEIQSVEDEKLDVINDQGHSYVRSRATWYLSGFFTALILSVAMLFGRQAWQSSSFQATTNHTSKCGNSSAEAVAAGCALDVVSFTWLPSRCHDAELMAEFLSLKEWGWWWNEEGSQPIPWEHVIAGNYTQLYVTWEYHLRHCSYMWKKMHRSILNGFPMDSYMASYHHTLHCEAMLLDNGELGALGDRNTIAKIKYAECPLD